MLTFIVMWQGGWVVVVAEDALKARHKLMDELDQWNF